MSREMLEDVQRRREPGLAERLLDRALGEQVVRPEPIDDLKKQLGTREKISGPSDSPARQPKSDAAGER